MKCWQFELLDRIWTRAIHACTWRVVSLVFDSWARTLTACLSRSTLWTPEQLEDDRDEGKETHFKKMHASYSAASGQWREGKPRYLYTDGYYRFNMKANVIPLLPKIHHHDRGTTNSSTTTPALSIYTASNVNVNHEPALRTHAARILVSTAAPRRPKQRDRRRRANEGIRWLRRTLIRIPAS